MSLQSLGQDSGLSHFSAEYRASAHLWLALHAHRRADPEQTDIVARHVDLACKILEPVVRMPLIGDPSPKVPKKSATAKQTTKRAPVSRRLAPVRKTVAQRDPVTPHQKTRTALQPASATPPKDAPDPTKSPVPFDNFEKFFGLLREYPTSTLRRQLIAL